MKHHVKVTADTFEMCKQKGYLDINDTFKIVQVFDDHGNHQLVFGEYSSKWFHYRQMAVLRIANVGCFIGTSEYYAGDMPRVMQVFESLTESLKGPDVNWGLGGTP